MRFSSKLIVLSIWALLAVVANAQISSTKRICVDFTGETPRAVLRNVADIYQINLVLPDSFPEGGKVRMRLKNVDWREIFELALGGTQFTYLQTHTGVVRVIPVSSEAKRIEILQDKIEEEISENQKLREIIAQLLVSRLDKATDSTRTALARQILKADEDPDEILTTLSKFK